MSVQIGINGFGRVGRVVLRQCLARGLQVKTINDPYIDYCQTLTGFQSKIFIRNYNSQKPPSGPGLSGAKIYGSNNKDAEQQHEHNEPLAPIEDILEREIQDETAELSQHLSTDQFPGFSVETDDSDVKLTKQIGNTTVKVRFTVSSSLSEWPNDDVKSESQNEQAQEAENVNTTLVSMPEFQVQIKKDNKTLEMSCYFEEMEHDEETGEPYSVDPVFGIDELVLYEGDPKETEFAVSAEYFQEDLQAALLQYLGKHGIDDEFAKNLVGFATSYEKKQYIGLMKRLKSFVSK